MLINDSILSNTKEQNLNKDLRNERLTNILLSIFYIFSHGIRVLRISAFLSFPYIDA